MIIYEDFAPYLLVSPNLRFEVLKQYIVATYNIDLKSLLETDLYNEFTSIYNISYKINSFTTGTTTKLEIDDTSLINTTNYVFVDTNVAKARFKYNVISATEIEVEWDTTSVTASITGTCTYFCDYDFFEKLRPFLVVATWIRYSQLGKIQSTNAGLVQKNTDFSEIVSDKEIGIYLQQWKRDLDFYKNEILLFLNKKCNAKRNRQVYAVTKKYKYDR